ncbi:sporulation protein [Streptomyces yaizuensis]|uniref:Sporulation protein n=1 Tax=Streptomyces yaizuensis TaxID=2989713 RepID=A0ABQ5P852_9ACTN|nr:sporulation protein [Streptomyces sp. YSPA8]GLF98740.1 sporulation protein [Streptomyces sp. YSPA8]
MVFKRLLGSLGVGGPTVDTVLDPGPVLPGGTLSGQVRLRGGGTDADIENITLELVARVETEYGDGEGEGTVSFARFTVGGGFRLAAGEHRDVPFGVTLPWETPVTELHGQPLGIGLGVRTELAVSGARDKGDLDPLAVAPLPVQEAVLEALGRHGFGFRSADLEHGRIHGTGQRLPFYQEIELTAGPRYAHVLNELEVTFLAHPDETEVILEADKPAGFFAAGQDVVNRQVVGHEGVAHRDWTEVVGAWLDQVTAGRGHASDGHASDGHVPHGHASHGHGHGHGHGSGPGMGAVVAAGAVGVAVGVAGGLVAAEVVDEVGDFFEGEGEDDEG